MAKRVGRELGATLYRRAGGEHKVAAIDITVLEQCSGHDMVGGTVTSRMGEIEEVT